VKQVSSGDRLVDWFFNKVVTALNEDIEAIRIKNKLLDGQQELLGFLENDIIYLSKENCKNLNFMTKVLLHELLHSVFDDLSEEDVLKLENLLWKRLSKKQKEILKFYLPKF
jgi:hypothetical protein